MSVNALLHRNGARQYPDAITLALTDAKGKVHQGVLAELAVIAGRVDPFIVPLPHGASLNLSLDLTKYALYASGQFEELPLDPTKQYSVQAQFRGRGVSQAEANLDVKGLALIPYWTGVPVSNAVFFGGIRGSESTRPAPSYRPPWEATRSWRTVAARVSRARRSRTGSTSAVAE